MHLGRAHRLEIDGVNVHAVEWRAGGGRPGRPTPEETPPRAASTNGDDSGSRRVLLVHGLGANTISWMPVGQPLAERLGATVTAIDLIGFGRTRAPERQATIATNRALVTELLDDTGPALVIGNSMGAVIATGVAARRPDLVDGLVLVNPALPWGRVGPGDWWRLARLAPLMMPSLGRRAVAARARVIGPERLVDLTLDLCVADRSRVDPAIRQRLVQLAAERYAYSEAPAAYADAARSLLRELTRGVADRDLAGATMSTPTLLVHGEQDRLVCADLARQAANRHGAIVLEILDGVGHAPQLEVPDRLVEVVAGWPGARMGPWEPTRAGAAGPAPGTRVAASSGSRSGPSSPS